jgi:hypothetical protein
MDAKGHAPCKAGTNTYRHEVMCGKVVSTPNVCTVPDMAHTTTSQTSRWCLERKKWVKSFASFFVITGSTNSCQYQISWLVVCQLDWRSDTRSAAFEKV